MMVVVGRIFPHVDRYLRASTEAGCGRTSNAWLSPTMLAITDKQPVPARSHNCPLANGEHKKTASL